MKANMKEKGHVTIEDIAKAVGVSISTVSRVLNSSAPVSKLTRRKVLKVVEDLHFTPNAMASGLVKKTSRTIGVMIPYITNPFFIELIKGVEDVACKYGFSMFLCNTNQVPEKEKFYINEMLKRRTDGLIIISTSITDKEIMEKAKNAMEIVAVQADIEDVDRVDTTDEQGMSLALEHLIELGHRRIALIGYRLDVTAVKNRFLGYQRTLEKFGIPFRDEYVIKGDLYGDAGYFMTKKLLELKEIPTAIQCLNDNLAVGAYLAITESKLRIPHDISLSGFDNIIISKLMNPQLTTVAQPIYSMGETAGELLIKNILEGSKPIKQSIVLPTRLIVRDSTAAPGN